MSVSKLVAWVSLAMLPCAAAASEWAVAVFPSGAEFTLEIAADPASRQRGYMFRDHVGPREGMIFVFDTADIHTIWMKNCLVSLDIIWLDESLRVVDIKKNFQPCKADPCPNAGPSAPALYVLEVAGGVTDAEKLKRGDAVVILPEVPRAGRP